MRNIFNKKIEYDDEEVVEFKKDFNKKLETVEDLGFNAGYLLSDDPVKPNDKVIEFDIYEDDDMIIKLLKNSINKKKMKMIHFIKSYGHNSGNNLINSLKNRKNLQGKSRKKIMEMLNSIFIAAIINKTEYESRSKDSVIVMVDEQDLKNSGISFTKLEIETD